MTEQEARVLASVLERLLDAKMSGYVFLGADHLTVDGSVDLTREEVAVLVGFIKEE